MAVMDIDYRALFKGDYISAVEFAGKRPTLTIAEVRLVPLPDEKTGRDKDKGVVFFRGQARGWVLCKTNAICLAGMFGPQTGQWVGKRVTLYACEVQFGREKVPGIRVLGSPDLQRDVRVEVKLPRKKPFIMTMQCTGRQQSEPLSVDPEAADAERALGGAEEREIDAHNAREAQG